MQGNICLLLMGNLCFTFPPPTVFLFNTHGEQPIRQDKFGDGHSRQIGKISHLQLAGAGKGRLVVGYSTGVILMTFGKPAGNKVSVGARLTAQQCDARAGRPAYVAPFPARNARKIAPTSRRNTVPESEIADVDGDLQEVKFCYFLTDNIYCIHSFLTLLNPFKFYLTLKNNN
ncbi:Protein translocase subunit [Frankliniella fusca]|uniref:Protein translocase subunit n=1 Tax=Frankliniella fusca TaxID=407009 RepID=A0AAE1H0K3_9NEOP|nr:Protein translocase subunit [Frankliniella fusca]KAK3916124.1 Protein translocase subunit [Frankliniella fusca]